MLREDVTAAIRGALVSELADRGFAGLTIEGVARRAGVGKPAVYRRWPSKLAMLLDVLPPLVAQGLPSPSTGSLEGDLRALVQVAAGTLTHPTIARIVPDLLAEARRDTDVASSIKDVVLSSQRTIAARIVREAVGRGELAAAVDPDRVLEVTLAPVFWRVLVSAARMDERSVADVSATATAILRVLAAVTPSAHRSGDPSASTGPVTRSKQAPPRRTGPS